MAHGAGIQQALVLRVGLKRIAGGLDSMIVQFQRLQELDLGEPEVGGVVRV